MEFSPQSTNTNLKGLKFINMAVMLGGEEEYLSEAEESKHWECCPS